MKYIVAIDQGTTGSRAVAYDVRGRPAASEYEEFPQHFPRPGWVEHDPEQVWASVQRSLRKVASALPKGTIAAIGITNQRETTVVWDARTGEPMHNAIVWQCRRTAQRCEELKARAGEAAFFRSRTGLPIDAYFSATKLEWLLQHVPGAAARARAGRLRFGTMDTWVLHKLTNGAVHATDYTNASRTMLFNINSLAWDRGILERFKIPASMLPRVQSSSGSFGETAGSPGIPAGIPITGIAGDQQAALFGQGCFEPGTSKITYGTGAFLLLNTGRRRVASKHGLITTLAVDAAGGPAYCLEGAVFIAGAAIQWLRDGLKLLSKASDSQKLAVSVKDNGGVYFVPALVGLGAPYWNPRARGSIYGITRGTRAEHLVRAALEAVCYQARDVISAMEKDSGIALRELRVDGGAAANDFMCGFQADILGLKVVRPAVIETTSLGAAYLAGLAAGYWKDTAAITKSCRDDTVFRPRMKRAEAERLYAGWKDAVKRTAL